MISERVTAQSLQYCPHGGRSLGRPRKREFDAGTNITTNLQAVEEKEVEEQKLFLNLYQLLCVN